MNMIGFNPMAFAMMAEMVELEMMQFQGNGQQPPGEPFCGCHDGAQLSPDVEENECDGGNPLNALMQSLCDTPNAHNGCPASSAAPNANNGCPAANCNTPQAHKMHEGQSYTTPNGDVISWHGDKVSVKEPGGKSVDLCQPPTPGREWSVWGDPHIKNPDGSAGQFEDGAKGAKDAGLFQLQDGTMLLLQAAGPKKPVKNVTVFPSGADLSGFNPDDVTYWNDNGGAHGGKFVPQGTVAQAFPCLAF